MTAIAPIVGRENDMKLCLIAVFASLACGLAIAGADDERRPLRDARSENGRYQLRIRTHRSAGESGACCYAELFERPNGKERPRRLWHEKLVNEVAPTRAVIHNGGRYVVTLDEFRRGGAAHALAIYDEKGAVLREYDLRELLRKDDWPHVKVEGRALEWLTDARFAFADEPPQFSIRLKWGREIRIDLRTGELADKTTTATQRDGESESGASSRPGIRFDSADVPAEILALFDSVSPITTTDSGSTASDSYATSTSEAVLRALAKLQALAQISGLADRAGIDGIPVQAGLTNALAEIVPPDEKSTENGEFAGNSATAGLGVPLPDPAHPVDYVAWVLEQTRTEGPSAVPLYQSARDLHVPWEGSDELRAAAVRGDPEALAAPEIVAWIEANQRALAALRSAVHYDYRGLLEVSPDDYSVVGILLPNLSTTRDLTRIVILEAKMHEQAGDYEAARRAYLDNFAVGVQISQGPTLIENLVGMAIHRATADSLLDSYAADYAERIDYLSLVDDLDETYRATRPIAECLQGERAMYFDTIQRTYEWNSDLNSYRVADSAPEMLGQILGYASDRETVGPETLIMCYALGNVGFEKMIAQANDYYDRVTAAAMLPYPQGKYELERVEAQIDDPAFRLRNPLMATLMPSLRRCTQVAARNEAARNAVRLITNLKAYRQAYGRYPDSLDVFGESDVTFDPYAGGRFAYISRGDDFELYSLGENATNDGAPRDASGQSNYERYWPRPARE